MVAETVLAKATSTGTMVEAAVEAATGVGVDLHVMGLWHHLVGEGPRQLTMACLLKGIVLCVTTKVDAIVQRLQVALLWLDDVPTTCLGADMARAVRATHGLQEASLDTQAVECHHSFVKDGSSQTVDPN